MAASPFSALSIPFAAICGIWSLVASPATAVESWEIYGKVEDATIPMETNVVDYYQTCFKGLGFTTCRVSPSSSLSSAGSDTLVPELDNAPFHWSSWMRKDGKYCISCCGNTGTDPVTDIVQSWNFTCALTDQGADTILRREDLDTTKLFNYEWRFAKFADKAGAPGGEVTTTEINEKYITKCRLPKKVRGQTLWGYELTIHTTQRVDGMEFWRSVESCSVKPVYGPDYCKMPWGGRDCDTAKCNALTQDGSCDHRECSKLKDIQKHCAWFNETIVVVSKDGAQGDTSMGTLIAILAVFVFFGCGALAYNGGWINLSKRGPGPD